MDEPPDTYTVGGVGRICDQADGPKLRRNEKMITTLFDRSIRAPSRGGQQIKSLWAWNQPGIWPSHRAVTSNSTSQGRLLAPSRQVNGIRRLTCVTEVLYVLERAQKFSERVVDGRHHRAGRLSSQRCEARAFQLIAIKQIVRVERNQAPVGMHDVDAGFLHGAHIECVSIQKLHDEHTENIFVGQLAGRRDFWQTAQKFAQ